ncbi:hypothetical protein [Neochlamydia sp. AcF95]|uniref:hypothetical protein n=1 Tax=Neochlamydia sp. AcF95 TaxID=2795734 RepID=UPI001BC9A0D8|nr:hypothetical protein [Neochlamydia sp. AcF95]MBS4169915.1 hypothetical protein [Neochlamydia sp. AcF95]
MMHSIQSIPGYYIPPTSVSPNSVERMCVRGTTDPQICEDSLNFNPQEVPGKIAHNSNPNSCYVAVLLNTICDENLKTLFNFPQAAEKTKSLSNEFKEKIGEIIRKHQSLEEAIITERHELLTKLKEREGRSSLSERERAILDCLEPLLQQMEQEEEIEETSTTRQMVNKIVNLIRNEIADDLQGVIAPCIHKINQGSMVHYQACHEGVVSLEEISQIQAVLTRYNFIERDSSSNEDPMDILGKVLEYVAPTFTLIKGIQIQHYNLDEVAEAEIKEVTLSSKELGPSGLITADKEGKSSIHISDNTVTLSSQTGQIDLLQALNQYLTDFSESDVKAVYVPKEGCENTYLKYPNVRLIKTTKTFLEVPSTLILEVSGSFDSRAVEALETHVTFQEQMQVTSEDGVLHYYVLQQVNCHQGQHEYVYLKRHNTWYLSDDMHPVRKATIEQASLDAINICQYGRTFIYKKVDKEFFEKIGNQVYQLSSSKGIENSDADNISLQQLQGRIQPCKRLADSKLLSLSVSPSASAENSAQDDMVSQQLEGLIKICKQLSDPKSASLQALLELSWGIGSIPKEKKFSKKWSDFILERHWLLLEDISRQIANRFPKYPNLSSYYKNESQKLVSQFLGSAKILVTIFVTLKDIENNTPTPLSSEAPEKLSALHEIETLFYPDFDTFVLEQVERNIQVVKTALDSQSPVNWLREDDIHIKALFRTIEVIGEASKILSEKARQQLPTLMISINEKKDKPLWGKLRNQLHHNKSRSWDIAKLAPEKWTDLLTQLLPQLEKEITNYKQHTLVPNSHTTQSKLIDIKILETLSMLCGQEQFRDVRRVWHQIKDDFSTEPTVLKRILFGLENVEKNHFPNIWEKYAYPNLNPKANFDKNKSLVFEMLRIGRENLIKDSDITRLMPSAGIRDKNSAVAEMKNLLSSVSQANDPKKNKELARAFENLADQFVFLKFESISAKKDKKNSNNTEPKGILTRDAEKNEALKKLMSQRLSQVSPFQLSETTFKNPDQSLTEYGNLLKFYVKLKHHHLSQLIEKMKELLKKILAGWPEDNLNDSNISNLGTPAKGKSDPKSTFIKYLKEFQAEEHLVQLPIESNLTQLVGNLKTFPANRIAYLRSTNNSTSLSKLIEEINEDKSTCIKAIQRLNLFLSQIICNEPYIQSRVKADFITTIKLFETIGQVTTRDREKAKQDLQTIEKIFTRFAFTDTTTFIEKLDAAQISHSFSAKASSLNSLRMKVLSSFKSQIETDLENKVDELSREAEAELSILYVRKALTLNDIEFAVFKITGVEAKRHVALLRDIYRAGLDEHTSDYHKMLLAWGNIERKITCQRLSAKKLSKVLQWLPSDDEIKNDEKRKVAKKNLIAYLNGFKGFGELNLGNLPRFEHGYEKIKVFRVFLKKEFFSAFPTLKDKKDELIFYFKIAYKIVGDQTKAEHFSKLFVRKIGKLGTTFSRILKLEEKNPSSSSKGIHLLSAEYEMQDIGELAQLITDRPSLWNHGRHILSPQHLLWLSIMRKMMAHYPLMLAPHAMRWNLEYLAFDTNSILSNSNPISFDLISVEKPKRNSMISHDLGEKIFDIKDHLDRLNLSLNLDILHPSLHTPYQDYLHPFGDLALMVYPGQVKQSKVDFIHAVMELELILNYELDAKVSVIGGWEEEFINIPSEKYMPQEYLMKMIKEKQLVDNWILSIDAYKIFLNKPWSSVVYKSGLMVTRGDFELYHDLVFFLKVLEFQVGQDDLKQFLNQPHLKFHIYSRLAKQLPHANACYSESTLFKWICCLFERFCPPGVVPHHPVCLPKAYNNGRPLITMLDKHGNGLQLMPENREEGEYLEDEADETGKNLYYRDNKRWDFLNERSLLDPSMPAKASELIILAEYAASVLTHHATYIQEKLRPENGLDRPLFSQVQSIRVKDPELGEKPKRLSYVAPDIEQLIAIEAKDLGDKIIKMVNEFSMQHGKKFCSLMLDWMKVDKEIQQVAQGYYEENRPRLRKLYTQMDDISQGVFDDLYFGNGFKWGNFPCVNNFRIFLDRIHLETNSLNVDDSAGRPQVSGNFSDNFKLLVNESDVQESLLQLMKERELTMHFLVKFFPRRFSNFRSIEDEINFYYTKWDRLFRMVSSPKVFEALKKNISSLFNKESRAALHSELTQDFQDQYKIASKEYSVANSDGQKICLYDARVYFEGKNDMNQAKQQHENFMKLQAKPDLKDKFLEEWEEQYGEPLKPLLYKNLIVEAREAVSTILGSNKLFNPNFDDAPNYSMYWTFMEENYSVRMRMFVFIITSGLKRSFKHSILEGMTFQKIWDNPVKRQLLEKNKRMHKLIKAYIPFFELENTLSDLSHFLKSQYNTYVNLLREKENAEQLKKEDWVLSHYNKRLKYVQYRFEKVYLRFKDTLDKIARADFFNMLKLWVKRKHFLENNGELLSDGEQKEQSLEMLFGENAITTQELNEAFKLFMVSSYSLRKSL